jgi:hypothetical protein
VVFVGEVCEKLKEGLSKNLNGILLTLFLLLETLYGLWFLKYLVDGS